MTPDLDDRAEREMRCPDKGYCHGSTFAAGSEPCPAGTCRRVRTAGPLSGVFPGDRWPDDVRAANGLEPRGRFLLLRFEVDEGAAITDDELLDLADRMVAEQIDPDPPVLTYDGADVVTHDRP